MGFAHNTIAFRPEKCDGCGDCMTACAQAKAGSDDLAHSRITITTNAITDSFELALCRQCGDPKCVMNCPSGALTKDEESGLVPWDADKCVDCLLCTVGCAYGGITFNSQTAHVQKCDMCDGAPACVKACSHGALEHRTVGDIYNRVGDWEDMFVKGLSGCQGCNSELLMRHTMRRVGANSVLATPPGCIPGMGSVGYNGMVGCKVPVFHPLLTNTASMLAGIKRQYERVGRDDIMMVALAGDGGTTDVGFQSLSGAAERGDKMLFICADNEGYMNTGMQRSSSTSYGSWTTTTPVGPALHGKSQDAKNMPVIMMMHNCEYVATASLAYIEDYYEKLDKAIDAAKRGMAYLHVYAPCPSGWRFGSGDTIEICRMGVDTNFVTLWEYERDTGLRFTRPVDDPLPVVEYLKLNGKYRHLSEEQIAHIQAKTIERVDELRRFEIKQENDGESHHESRASA